MNLPSDIPWIEEISSIENQSSTPRKIAHSWRFNLLRFTPIRILLQSRWPQFLVRALTLAGFVFTIVAGLFGSRVGSHNFAIIFVWIAWWTALKLAFIPFGGRSWCSICPIPLPGEWLQQAGILEPGKRRLGLNRRWPKHLKGSWIQSSAFLLIGLFSAVTLTNPSVTAWVLLGLFFMAILLSLIFERRAFCSYICPIGGFSGIYAQAAPVELRVLDTGLCSSHTEKTCYRSCPWGLYPLALRNNVECSLCLECLRACPRDNIALNMRPFGSDLGRPRSSNRLDEAFLSMVMLGSALAFAAVFTGPWGTLRSAAFAIASPAWLLYSLGFLTLNLVLIPGLFSMAAWLSHKWAAQEWTGNLTSLRREVSNLAQTLLPLGLFAWIAFTVSFALPKLNYVLSVLSDPLGWGWNLLGTANTTWSPNVAGFSSLLQVVLLSIGLIWSTRVATQLSKGENKKPSVRRVIPVLVFCVVYSLAMLWLLVG